MTEFEFNSLTLRAEVKADKHFVRELYCTSRDYEIKHVPWPEAQIKTFLKEQFALQSKHFSKVYPKADKQLICANGQPIGRLYTHIDRKNKQLHLIDITLTREFRGLGIGRYLLGQLMAKAKESHLALTLYVHSQNPAAQFYLALGFKSLGSQNGYLNLRFSA